MDLTSLEMGQHGISLNLEKSKHFKEKRLGQEITKFQEISLFFDKIKANKKTRKITKFKCFAFNSLRNSSKMGPKAVK